MRIYNVIGYGLITGHLLASGLTAPDSWGFAGGVLGGVGYLTLLWLLGGLFMSNVLHMGIAHKALDYKPWFIKTVVLVFSVVAVYLNPTEWVNRHRHHHAFSDHEGDPSKLSDEGFFRTMYLCFFPRECRTNLAKDPILQTWPLRLTSSNLFGLFSQVSSFGLIWLVTRDVVYSMSLWLGVRFLGLWLNMIQNFWTHDRRFGTRRYDDRDNAMNLGEWLPVTATFSASLQNNHHHSPHFLRTSHAPGEYDFGFFTVRVLKAIGLVKATASGARKPEGIPLEEVGL
jgi:fatty-acid desaturase